MLKASNNFAKTTTNDALGKIIDDTLKSLHIKGSLLLRESYSNHWAISIPGIDQLAAILGVDSKTRVIAFHLVEFGHCEIALQGGKAQSFTAGEMVVCFGGEPHRVSLGKPPKTQSMETLLTGGANTQRPGSADAAPGTALLCGVFLLQHTEFNPLFAALPGLMRVSLSRAGELHNLSGVAHLMAQEIDRKSLGSGFIVERLLEVLCAEAVRAHIEKTPNREANWFGAIKDPVVGRAISAVHLHPGQDWSVRGLAKEVAMSPSRFAARFTESLGMSPMVYVTRWRMNVACRHLSTTKQGVDQVAASVGYESLAAFNRAFKKHLGLPPAAWRAQQRV